jgi:antitoxin component YwqK of YwqJK toxin-antitoxin module
MKRIIFSIFVVITASNFLIAQDTLFFYYDDDWNEIPDKDDAVYYRKAFLDHEVWTVHDYYISNKIQMTGTYKTKKLTARQGHFVYYYENGQKQSEGDFNNDQHEGQWTIWFENGQKKSAGNYIANNLEGQWKYWYESGEKKSEGIYIRSNKDGIWNYWYKNGQLESVEVFKIGIISSSKQYFKNGALHYTGEFLNGMRHGTWTFYNVDGRVYFSGNYDLGVKKGEWVRSFQDDKMIVNYNMGVIESKDFGGMVRKKWEVIH